MIQEENEGDLHNDQLKPIRDDFLSDVNDHLEAELQEHGLVEVRFVTTSTSMDGLVAAEPHFEIRTRITLIAARPLEEQEVAYIKERLVHWTKVIGDKLYPYTTESGHYISKVKIEFTTNGGKRKRKRTRKRKYKC